MIKLLPNLAQMIDFVLVDGSCAEVAGLGTTWNIEISKGGGAFNAGTGTQAEISDGWYRYTLTAAETDTHGPLAIKVTHASIQQQNMLYYIVNACVGCTERTYTVTTGGGAPIAGVTVQISTDVAGNYIIWCGTTDALGVARDQFGLLPCLYAGTYQFWRSLAGWNFDDPDEEIFT